MALSKNKPSATSILQRYRRMPVHSQRLVFQAFENGLNRVAEFGSEYHSKGSGDAEMILKKLLEAFAPNTVQIRAEIIQASYHNRSETVVLLPTVVSVRWWPSKAHERLGSAVEYKSPRNGWREARVTAVGKTYVTLTEYLTEWR